jgi:endonuclease YncB( thermonuclease family)
MLLVRDYDTISCIMMRFVLFIVVAILFSTASTPALARSGCCSHHGGVQANGCGCNDGSPLSNTCAPYYTCSAGQTQQAAPVVQQQTYTPVPVKKPVVKQPVYIPPTATPTLVPTSTPVPTATPIPTATPTPYKETSLDKKKQFKVVRVIDGETIVASIRGKEETVKLIGVNVPASMTKSTTEKLTKYVQDKNVKLVDDKTIGHRDESKNLLRYVYLPNKKKTFINGELIKQGLAYNDINSSGKLLSKFHDLETYAKRRSLGVWKANQSNATTPVATTAPTRVPTKAILNSKTTAVTPIPTQIQTNTITSNKTYTGGDKDCKDFGSHAEAQAFYISQGGPASDPHRLDADNDGSACDALR